MQTFKICEAINSGDVVALGDVHGQVDQFFQFLDWVNNTGARVVLLGDLVDRSSIPGGDIKVLEKAITLQEDPDSAGLESFIVIKGNHELMLLDAIEGYEVMNWANNGGDLDSLEELKKYSEWIRKLPCYVTIGDTLFIHGGVFPGHNPYKAILEGKADRLLWMRDPFLQVGPNLAAWTSVITKVVHGHTPTVYEKGGRDRVPIHKGDRVNIDTRAYARKGCLTAYNVTQDTFCQFFR